MPAKIITVANQKGGSGKTTVSMQLAGTLARRGYRVLVVDADPQATATRWAASASDEIPFPASVVGLSAANEKVHREVRKFIDDYTALSLSTAHPLPIPRCLKAPCWSLTWCWCPSSPHPLICGLLLASNR